VSARPANVERQEMISTLTTNVTSFYRESHHFEDLSARVLPNLLEKAKRGERVRIWSAACSSGEEPYSIAFEVLRQAPDASTFDLKILATDIDPEIVRIAERGEYAETAAKNLPRGIREKFLQDNKVAPAAKALISFRQLNLLNPLPFSGDFDVIFCRNVTIYFDPRTRDKTWQQIVSVLKPDGQLYAGHSERVSGPAAKYLKHTGLTAYKCIK
jgi:chemotaxis protein methyltransferase CheR